MEMTIHPLQKASVELLLFLYKDLGLPTTSAMLSVLNGYYPAVNEVLKTLSHYKDQPKVADFVKNHESEILSAKEYLEPKVASKAEIPHVENVFDSLLGSSFEYINAYKSLKTVSIESIESYFSEALSKACKEELLVEIDSVQNSEEGINFNAVMKLRIKPARLIR